MSKLTKNIWLQELVPPPKLLALDGVNPAQAARLVDPELPGLLQFIRERYGRPVRLNDWFWKENGTLDLRGWRPNLCGIVRYLERKGFAGAERIKAELLAYGYPEEVLVTGSWLSQHKYGRAADFTVDGLTPNEVRADMLANQALFMQRGLTAIESEEYAPSWVHIDMRITQLTELLIVKPAA